MRLLCPPENGVKCAVALFAVMLCTAVGQDQPAPVKLCVAMVKNQSMSSINTRFQQYRLVNEFNTAKKDKKGKLATVEALPLQTQSPAEAAGQARDQGCVYVLYTTVATVHSAMQPRLPNQPSNITIGSDPLGRTGPPSGLNDEADYEAEIQFELYSVGETAPKLAGSTHGREQGNAEQAVSAGLNSIVNRTRAALAKR